jgi:hypothetical protein
VVEGEVEGAGEAAAEAGTATIQSLVEVTGRARRQINQLKLAKLFMYKAL